MQKNVLLLINDDFPADYLDLVDQMVMRHIPFDVVLCIEDPFYFIEESSFHRLLKNHCHIVNKPRLILRENAASFLMDEKITHVFVGHGVDPLPDILVTALYTQDKRKELSFTQKTRVPARVDFAGGWLDVPSFQKKGGYIVNCAISPCVSLDNYGYRKYAGLGGSGIYAVLSGVNPVASELALNCGWQDPAVVFETGCCCWHSGHETPVLEFKNAGAFLKGCLALYDTGTTHSSAQMSQKKHPFKLLKQASFFARQGIWLGCRRTLALGIGLTYQAQLIEEMDDLPLIPEALAYKYCGAGGGGYSLYLFDNQVDRDNVVRQDSRFMAIEPYFEEQSVVDMAFKDINGQMCYFKEEKK